MCLLHSHALMHTQVAVVSVIVLEHPLAVPVEDVRRVLRGFKAKTVVFLADENCEVDQGTSSGPQPLVDLLTTAHPVAAKRYLWFIRDVIARDVAWQQHTLMHDGEGGKPVLQAYTSTLVHSVTHTHTRTNPHTVCGAVGNLFTAMLTQAHTHTRTLGPFVSCRSIAQLEPTRLCEGLGTS